MDWPKILLSAALLLVGLPFLLLVSGSVFAELARLVDALGWWWGILVFLMAPTAVALGGFWTRNR